MVEQERDDKTEQAARDEESKQEAAQLLKRQRQQLLGQLIAPSNVLGLLSLYVIFVGTVVAFGVLAFYTGHKITQEIVFFSCIILFLILPISAIWYLRPIFTKTSTAKGALSKQTLLDKLKQYSIGRALIRLSTDRNVRLVNLALYASMIAIQIRQFPLHPRFSLANIVIYMVLGFASVILWVTEAIERNIYTAIYERILQVLEIIEGVRDTSRFALRIAERSLDFIEGTDKSHSEAHETSTVALRAVKRRRTRTG